MQNLDQWEKRLKPYFAQKLAYIGEIPLSFNDIDDLVDEVRQLIQQLGLTKTTRVMSTRYPLTLLTLMAGFAAFNTQRDFWQSFADAIGADRMQIGNKKWHKIFVNLAREQGLKVFDFEDDPTPYVTSIRYQGGIPSYSLGDYFERMVLPSVERTELREVTAPKALAYLLGHAYFIDSPVLDFLSNSGELGIQFFAESRKLYRYAAENHGALLNPDDVQLPENVVVGFSTWWDNRETARQHWSRPYLQAAPYTLDSAVNLILPKQEIILNTAASRFFWRVKLSAGFSLERTCRISRSQQCVVTDDHFLPITKPVEQIEVSFLFNDQASNTNKELRRWNLSLIPSSNRPRLIAFNAQTIQTATNRQLPKGEVFLLTPADSQLVFDGEAREIEKLNPLIGEWQAWQLSHWDLSQVWSVTLQQQGQLSAATIPVQETTPLPELTGGHLFQFQDQKNPLYTSELPGIKIPLSKGGQKQARLAFWQMDVHSVLEADPVINRSVRIADFADKVDFQDDHCVLPLAVVLGQSAAGAYELRLKGPHGMTQQFGFHSWPKLLLVGHSMELRQAENEPTPHRFQLMLQPDASCMAQPDFDQIKITPSAGSFQIEVPPDYNRADLYLTAPGASGGTIRVPLSIPLPRLRWSLASANQAVEWGQTVIQRSIDQLLQEGDVSVHLEMYGLGKYAKTAVVQLIEIGEDEKLMQAAPLTHTDFTCDWMRVPLAQFNDTIKHIASMGRMDLIFTSIKRDGRPIRFPLMEISRSLKVSNVALKQMDELSWKITWQEDQPLKNRRVMILPAWQPWQEPWEYKIPDEAHGEYLLEKISLPPSSYLLYFYVLPDYHQHLCQPPENVKAIQCNLCTPQQRLASLKDDSLSPNIKFMNLIEKAIICHEIGDQVKRDEILSKAAISINHLSKPQLLISTLKWMKNKDIDQPTKSFYFNRIFNFNIVEVMLSTYKKNDPQLVDYLAYTNEAKIIPADSAKLLLKNIDDPITTANCLRHLFNKKDDDLIPIMLNMISSGRLSRRDAFTILQSDPSWAIKSIAQLDSNPTHDSMIAELLPKLGQENQAIRKEQCLQWMLRALPYEKNEVIIENYLHFIFGFQWPQRFKILLQSVREQRIPAENAFNILAESPKDSLKFLESLPEETEVKGWMEKLVEKYPSIAGFVTVGSEIMTPFGRATINYIEKGSDPRVDRVRLGDADNRIAATIGNEFNKFRLYINYQEMTIRLDRTAQVYKCSKCSFMHPNQNDMNQHIRKTHQIGSFRCLSLPIKFSEKDIYLIE